MKIALVGMPNCGKSTLFNRLTGKNARTGNRAGVTVSVTDGKLRADPRVTLTDLPGVYSPEPRSRDEALTLDALKKAPPELVLFVADGTQLSRADALFEYIRRNHRTVLAVNMCDELAAAGMPLDSGKLENILDLPVFAISAKSGQGVDALARYLKGAVSGQSAPQVPERIKKNPDRQGTPGEGNVKKRFSGGGNHGEKYAEGKNIGQGTHGGRCVGERSIREEYIGERCGGEKTTAQPVAGDKIAHSAGIPRASGSPTDRSGLFSAVSATPLPECAGCAFGCGKFRPIARTPAPENTRPTSGKKHPALGDKSPAPGGKNPAPDKNTPTTGGRYAVLGENAPASGSHYLTTDDRHLGTDKNATTGSRYAAAGDNASAPDSHCPTTGDRHPAPGNKHPSFGEEPFAPDERIREGQGGAISLSEAVRQLLPPPPPRGRLQNAADRLFLTPWTGFPLFFLFLAAALFLSFGAPGAFLAARFSAVLSLPLRQLVSLLSGSLPPFFAAFLRDGVLAGTVAVLDFAPRLFLLFLFLTVLEDSGYLARAGALCAPVLRFFGLSGEAAVPLLLGIGCSVPAVLSARHIGDGGTRRLTVLLVPFIPCSARLPVLAVLAALFFASPFAARVIPVLGGVILFLLFAFLLSRKNRPAPFAGELPRFRLPSARNVWRISARRTGHFLKKAGLIIPLAAALLWLLSHITPGGTPTVAAETSVLARVSGAIAPLFAPLGFGCWQAVAALLSGIAAKESVLSALAVFAGGELSSLSSFLSPRGALSFLCFFATYCPCVATQSAVRREGGVRALAACLTLSFLGAYALSFAVYHL